MRRPHMLAMRHGNGARKTAPGRVGRGGGERGHVRNEVGLGRTCLLHWTSEFVETEEIEVICLLRLPYSAHQPSLVPLRYHSGSFSNRYNDRVTFREFYTDGKTHDNKL